MLGSHPREQFEAHFDIVTPSPRRPDHNEWVLVQHSLLVALCISRGYIEGSSHAVFVIQSNQAVLVIQSNQAVLYWYHME